MSSTIVFYSSAEYEKPARLVASIIGNAKAVTADEAPAKLAAYKNICLIAEKKPASKKLVSYLRSHADELATKQVGVIAPSSTKKDLRSAVAAFQKECGGPFAPALCAAAKNDDELAEAASRVAPVFKQPDKPMEGAALLNHIEAFIKKHSTCALATGYGTQIRCTPLEYHFSLGIFYIITEGGQKFAGLSKNENVSLSIFDPYKDMKHLASLQVAGTAEEIASDSKSYKEQMSHFNLTPAQVAKLPVTMHVIAIKPIKYELLDSSLASKGYDSHQTIEM
jgi:uncharacterized protein YhbP (UPF0306 family)